MKKYQIAYHKCQQISNSISQMSANKKQSMFQHYFENEHVVILNEFYSDYVFDKFYTLTVLFFHVKMKNY